MAPTCYYFDNSCSNEKNVYFYNIVFKLECVVKDVKYIYWVKKKTCLGVLKERRKETIRMKVKGREGGNRNINYKCFHIRDALALFAFCKFTYVRNIFLFASLDVNRSLFLFASKCYRCYHSLLCFHSLHLDRSNKKHEWGAVKSKPLRN